jgi:hypothetical protein
MGIFQDMVEVVNRTSEPLNLRYDGQDMAIPPNYNADGSAIEDVRTTIPRQCIPYVLSQNPVMGSEDPSDPSNFQSLVGIIDPKKNPKKKHSWYNCDFLPKAEQGIENMTRVNLRSVLEDDPQVKDIVVRGRKIDQVRPGQDGQDIFQTPQS